MCCRESPTLGHGNHWMQKCWICIPPSMEISQGFAPLTFKSLSQQTEKFGKEYFNSLMKNPGLMARPRAQKGKGKVYTKSRYEPYVKGKGKFEKGKGKFKGGKGKSQPPQNWAKSFVDASGTQKEFCFRFHTSGCSFKNCKFAHLCPIMNKDG